MTGCVELINTGRSATVSELRDLADLQAMADRYAFAGVRAGHADVTPGCAHYRARLDAIVGELRGGRRGRPPSSRSTRCCRRPARARRSWRTTAAARTCTYRGRRRRSPTGWRPTSPWAWPGSSSPAQAGRIRSCQSPTCRRRVRRPVQEQVAPLLRQPDLRQPAARGRVPGPQARGGGPLARLGSTTLVP